jgi:lysophospholipase L1-like esterase
MKTIFRITVVVLCTALLLVLLGEAYLRWHYFGLPTSEKHRPHPYLQTVLRRDVPFIDGEALTEKGFRRTGATHTGEDVRRVLVVGDSCAFSISSSTEAQSFPSLLEAGLNRAFEAEFEVTNAGVPGYGSLQMLLWLAQVFDEVHPDEVVIYGGWNDFRILMHDRGMLYIENNCLGMPRMYRHRDYWALRDPDAGLLHRTLRRLYLYDMLAFRVEAHYVKERMREFRRTHALSELPPDPLLLDEVFTHFEINLENMIALARGRGAEVSLVTLGTPLRRSYTPVQERTVRERFDRDFLRLAPAEMSRYVFAFNDILRDLGKRHGCEVYDWERWYHGAGDDDASMFVDLVHPSDEGYGYLTDRILSRLTSRAGAQPASP